MRKNRGQVLVILAFLFIVVLLILAVLIDGARLMIEKQELQRAADAAGKAGLLLVGDQMMTQAVRAQHEITCTATEVPLDPGTAELVPSATPPPTELTGWLDEEDRSTLISPPIQTSVSHQVLEQARRNGKGLENPEITEIIIDYPAGYQPHDRYLHLAICIHQKVDLLFGHWLGPGEGILVGESRQKIPQR